MKAFILAGGEGKRLRPLTYAIPKPLLPVGEKPVLEILIENLKKQGFDELIISVGYKSWLIKSYFSDGGKWDIKITYVDEDKKLGTAGPLKKIAKQLMDSVVVVNGDLVTDLDFASLSDFHERQKADMTVCTIDHVYNVPYGVIRSDESLLLGYDEKPKKEVCINAGIYVLNPKVLSFIPEDEYFDMSQLIDVLIKEKMRLVTYHFTGRWVDIGCMDDFEKIINSRND